MQRFIYPLIMLVLAAVYAVPLHSLYVLAHTSDSYSHLIFMPFLALFFVFYHRRQLVKSATLSVIPAVITASTGGVILLCSQLVPAGYTIVKLDLTLLSWIVFSAGITILFFGVPCIVSTRFSWLLLLLTLPLPTVVLDGIINFFRDGSAEVVDFLMQAFGINYIRDNLTFHLPTLSIYIAKECSGIRSSTALVITGLLAGHLSLRTWWGKSLFLLMVIPLTFIKNGIRITTLTILAAKYDHAWLDGSLHHKGGIVFFGLILLLFFAILFLIQKLERKLGGVGSR
jgi:exosortase